MAFVPDQQQPAPTQAASRFVPDAPPKPFDPMVDPPRLPGEEGYAAPRKAPERSGVMEALKYVSDYLGGLKDAALDPVAAPGRQGGTVDNLVADVGDIPLLGHAYGAAESATTLATSALAPALASVKGAVTGKEPTNADIEALTFSPRTSVGAGINKVARAAMKPVADVAEATGADAALLPLAPELNAISPGPRVPKAAKAAPAAPNMADPATAARAAGYKILPSEAGAGRVLQTLESLGGPNTKKDFRRANEATTTKLAKDEIGAPSVDDKGIAKVREAGDAAYDAMSGIGRVQADDQVKAAVAKLAPRQGMRANADIAGLQSQFEGLLDQPWDAGAVVTEVRQLRKEANANSAPPALGAKPDPKKTALAKAQLQVANALDDWLERNATAVGSPEIAQQYKEARTRLAKTASVERASAGGKTDVRNLERQDERGVPHTGRLKIASQTGEYFPESTGSVSGPEINVTPDSLFGTVRQFAQSNLLRPIVSRLLQSDMVQNRFGQQLGDVGPDSPLGAYFEQPAPRAPYQPFSEAPAGSPLPRTSAESMRVANTLAGDLGLEPEGPTPSAGNLSLVPDEPLPTIEDFMDYQAGNPTPGQFNKLLAAGYVKGDPVSSRMTSEGHRARRSLAGEAEPEPMAMQQQQTGLGEAFAVQPSLRPGYSVLRGQGDAGAEVLNSTLGELFGDLNAPVTPIAASPTRMGRPLVTEQEFEASGGFKEKPAVKQTAPKKSSFTSERNEETGEISIESPDGAVIVRPRGQYLRVNYANVKPTQRGKGKGLALYEEAIRQAAEQGLQLASDVVVSKDAGRVYDALERRGYTITRNEADVDPKTGEMTSKNSARPVFVVESSPAE